MINFIAIPLELEAHKWIKVDDMWVFNTEYGYICSNIKYATVDIKLALVSGVQREWVLEGVKMFNPEDKILMMFVLDELIEKSLPHHHLGIYLRLTS